jgi:hypothetical protein
MALLLSNNLSCLLQRASILRSSLLRRTGSAESNKLTLYKMYFKIYHVTIEKAIFLIKGQGELSHINLLWKPFS